MQKKASVFKVLFYKWNYSNEAIQNFTSERKKLVYFLLRHYLNLMWCNVSQ